MSADLTTLLTQAEDELEGTVPAAGDALAGRLHAGTRRRRTVRHLREAAGGLAVVVVVCAASWAVAAQDPPPAPTVSTPTPVETTQPSPTPTPDPSPSATVPPPVVDPGPVVRDDPDDATVLARQAVPRTGEVWQTPERAPEMEAVLSPDPWSSAWRVGSRGDATIVLVVDDAEAAQDFVGIMGVPGVLYEVDAAGPRAIVCPSARTSDPCIGDNLRRDGFVRDDATFYDTLTLPRAIELAEGWVLTTTATTSGSFYPHELFGDARGYYGLGGTSQVVADLGAAEVVRLTADGEVPGLSDVRYAIRTPFGTTIEISPDDAPSGEFEHIRWDDGVDRPLAGEAWVQSVAPSGGACFAGSFSVEERHVDADWRAAGTTPGGHRVHVPVAGGNAVSRAVRAWQEQTSFGMPEGAPDMLYGADVYPYPTDEEFLAAHALYAIQGPDGEWQLRLRADAVQVVYECA
ncbi:hypothetical protein [Actinotalea solisilvae]|uniref:hypothetical protein n=1 Tax=Actinotalea solisilvae TaxID=2072922 RepID=UPI0018F22257|nr:hypothetical protein [Actinotalea solisilvae]